MAAKITLNNNVATVKAEGAMFIIPNAIRTFSDLIEHGQRNIKRVCEMNEIEIPEDYSQIKLVEIWSRSDDLKCDNLADHYLWLDKIEAFNLITKNSVNKLISKIPFPGNAIRFVPVNMFQGKKEGDVINIKFPYVVKDYIPKYIDNDNELDYMPEKFIFDIDFTLSQRGYLYRNFGNFEDVLKDLMTKS